jgi:osmotically inducible protein OsmC
MKIEKILYAAEVTSTSGRDGHARSSDGVLDVKLSIPKAMGGPGGDGTNPEQLFAAGYSACFLGAIKFVALQEKIKLSDDSNVTAHVGIGKIEGGFGLEITLNVSLPGLDKDLAFTVVEKADKICPYSNSTRNNIEVKRILV